MTDVTKIYGSVSILESNGRLIGIQLPRANLPENNTVSQNGSVRHITLTNLNIPGPECEDFSYFVTQYYWNGSSFVFVGEPPNEHAHYDLATSAWVWEADLLLKDIRRRRNLLLTDTDWTQLGDTTLTVEKRNEFQTYRTALRNITDNLDNPSSVQSVPWPTKPEFL